MRTAIVVHVLITVFILLRVPVADCQEASQDGATQTSPIRPTIVPNRRWEEDWSVLADPRVQREPLDDLKYLPFSRNHPETYLSTGFNLRERLESDHAPFFGTIPGREGSWLLSRLEVHADLHLGEHVQVFAQLESAFAPGKKLRGPVDQDRLDLEQAFIGWTSSLGRGKLRLRLGRQLIAMDLQRFASIRDGPNLRQPYDAAYADYERGRWRFTGGYTRPVQTRDSRAFDDYSNHHLTFGGVLLRHRLLKSSQIAISYTRFAQDAATYWNAQGHEHRAMVNFRFSGVQNGLDWDVEVMNQTGHIDSQSIEARAFGSLVGYSFRDTVWRPHLGLGFDIATGDHDPHDNRLETLNPLFPNGYYLAGYTGYPNLIHVKPAVTVHPRRRVNLMVALASQWRETTADAVYVFPSFPVAGTAGMSGRYTGAYGEFRADWTVTPHYSFALEVVHYAIGSTIARAGGHDANYYGVEFRYGW